MPELGGAYIASGAILARITPTMAEDALSLGTRATLIETILCLTACNNVSDDEQCASGVETQE